METVSKIVKSCLNLSKLQSKYCRSLFSGYGVPGIYALLRLSNDLAWKIFNDTERARPPCYQAGTDNRSRSCLALRAGQFVISIALRIFAQ